MKNSSGSVVVDLYSCWSFVSIPANFGGVVSGLSYDCSCLVKGEKKQAKNTLNGTQEMGGVETCCSFCLLCFGPVRHFQC